jgi:hypothetical protein
MRENKPKKKSVKASKSNRTCSRTPAQLKKDAARILDIMNSAEVSNEIKYEIGCLIVEHVDAANLVERHAELFAECYVIRAKDSGDERAQRELERILDRLDAGEQLADVVVMTEARMRRQAQENRGPNFASLARNISGVLNDPNTPADIYNELADKVADLSDPYLESVRKTPDFIEKCLIFAARGTTTPVLRSTPAKDETRVLAEHIAAIIASPNAPDDVVEGLIRGMQETSTDANVHGDVNYVEAILRQRIKNTEGGAE